MSPRGGVWWVQRWLDPIVEAKELRVKVRKGRIVARRGRVENLTVRAGLVTATVEGESGGSHSVRLRQAMIHAASWDAVMEKIAGSAGLTALLLAGRISEDMVQLFASTGAELFPFDRHDLTYFCTCPDEGAVCLHSVAVHIALSEAIAADPMVLLEFRGRSRGELITALRGRKGQVFEEVPAEEPTVAEAETEEATVLADGFWEAGVMPHLAFRLNALRDDEEQNLPVVRALGPGPAETSPEAIADALAPIARMAKRRIAEILDRVVEEDEIPQGMRVAKAESLDDVLVAAAYQHGALTSAFVSEALGVSQLEARRYLLWLVDEGRLQKVGRARGTKYVPPEASAAV